MRITQKQAKEFYRDLLRTIHTNGSSRIMSAELVADHMHISIEKADKFLWACVRYGIIDWQGSGFVV